MVFLNSEKLGSFQQLFHVNLNQHEILIKNLFLIYVFKVKLTVFIS